MATIVREAKAEELPRWDLGPLYSAVGADDFGAAMREQQTALAAAESFFDGRGIRRTAEAAADADAAATLSRAIELASDLVQRAERLEVFLQCLVTTNSYDNAAQQELSRLEKLETRRKQLWVRLTAWIGSLGAAAVSLADRQDALRSYAYMLRDAVRQSRYLMADELESLAAELCVDSGGAFGKLQGNVTSQLKVPLERAGRTELLPITVVRNLSYDSDEEVRRAAYQAEVAGWESVRTTVAACINGVKGTAHTLAKRRGRASVLDAALDQNKIDRATLDALLSSIRESLPVFRRYLACKARRLGKPRLDWWDLFAPLGATDARYDWAAARNFIVRQFSALDADLGDMAARAFDERWIDAPPRDGKRAGAYCAGVMAIEQSRVMANFDGSFEQVSTLAHELGHAYHNHCQRGLPPLLRGSPMTLAETASIFCEALICEAAAEKATPAERLSILESQLAGATQVCVDILSRFIFESEVLRRRAECELSADELCELMRSAQRETYADAISPETYHPYMWLWKPHYYAYDYNFYNFPYAFGHLFSLGLFAEYRRKPDGFVPRYRRLLRSTGQDDAAPLARAFGIDITRPDFWRASLAVVADQVHRYEKLP